jgi:uncharacterized protein
MVFAINEEVIFTISVSPRSGYEDIFLEWKKRLNSMVASFSGFISIEISISVTNSSEWVITQRFRDKGCLSKWQGSVEHQTLMNELNDIAKRETIKRILSNTNQTENGVTEVIVTRVNPGKETEFSEWMANVHQMEAKFPGFRGAYVQSPASGQGENWITLLQFDTNVNLDRWLSSSERKNVLKGSEALVDSLEQHRVISPYAGWFGSIAKNGEVPATWKQGMIVLLVLFPIVVLEVKFLMPYIGGLGLSLSTFIGNAISVSLVTWMMMPLAIKGLGWWLSPVNGNSHTNNCLGTLVVVLLYAVEVFTFWFLF